MMVNNSFRQFSSWKDTLPSTILQGQSKVTRSIHSSLRKIGFGTNPLRRLNMRREDSGLPAPDDP